MTTSSSKTPEKQAATAPPVTTSSSKAPEKQAATAPPVTTTQHDVYVQENPVALYTIGENANVEVQVDSYDDDADSAYSDSSGLSETTSVSSSVFSYTYSNGRRYHSDRFRKADYFLPNDDMEQERLDFHHHIYMLLLGGKLHLAPLSNPQRILDVGTGTGIWAIDMANDNPQAEIIGTDISPIQPNMVPPNCKFEVDDMEENWTYPKDHFDFIHMRSMGGSFEDWDTAIKQAFEHLLPGGFYEFQDYGFEGFFHDGRPVRGHDTPMAKFMDLLVSAAEKLKRPLTVATTIKDRMTKAGFVDIEEKAAVWPIGDWPKDKNLKVIGKWSRVGFLDSLDAFAFQLLTKGHGWTMPRAKKLCEEVAEDLKKASPNKYYFQGWFAWGRKPTPSK